MSGSIQSKATRKPNTSHSKVVCNIPLAGSSFSRIRSFWTDFSRGLSEAISEDLEAVSSTQTEEGTGGDRDRQEDITEDRHGDRKMMEGGEEDRHGDRKMMEGGEEDSRNIV